MAEFSPPDDSVLKDAWLERAPPQAVADWLSRVHLDDVQALLVTVFPQGALQKLLARNDKYIDLAIALYGNDPDVLYSLWRRNDAALRRAILTNQNRSREIFQTNRVLNFIENSDELLEFLKNASHEDLWILATNPVLKGSNLATVFERAGVFAALPIEQWYIIAIAALRNPTLHHPYEDPRYPVDPFPMLEHDKPIREAMRLLQEFPVEKQWALGLSAGYSQFRQLIVPTKSPEEVRKGTSKDFSDWLVTAEREFLESVFKRWTPDDPAANETEHGHPNGFQLLRMSIAGLVPDYQKELHKWLESYPDEWVQIGAAKRKRFDTPEEVDEWVDRHGWHFLNYVETNPSLHVRRNPAVVEKVRALINSTGDERPQKHFPGWEQQQFTASSWMHAANWLHKEAPAHIFAWDEDVRPQDEDDERADALRRDDPALDRIDEILDPLKRSNSDVPQRELINAVSRTITELHKSATRRHAELLKAITDTAASAKRDLSKLVLGAAVVIVILLLWHR